ncbi:MAG: hypothetical protein WBF71_04160 [Microthrixaceae bacterium]
MTMIEQPNYAPGMREAAGQLRAKVERAASLINRLDAQLASMTYSGPAADRFRAEMTQTRSILVRSNDLTCQAADILVRDALRIETQAAQGIMNGGSLS